MSFIIIKDVTQKKAYTPKAFMEEYCKGYSGYGLWINANGHSEHNLFTIQDNVFKRFTVRLLNNKLSCLSVYMVYNKTTEKFDSTPHQHEDSRPTITSTTTPFTKEEIEQLIRQYKAAELPTTTPIEFPYFKYLQLSQEQQKQLYLGRIDPSGQCVSFKEYLELEALDSRILEASIRADSIDDLALTTEDESSLRAFRYAFFSPNKIVNLSDTLYKAHDYQPNVGDVLQYYTACIKKLLETQQINLKNKIFREYTLATRQIKLGDIKHDFKEEGIYNPQGLYGISDILFRCLVTIYSLQSPSAEDIKNILIQDEFRAPHFQTKLLDYLREIERSNPEQNFALTQYIEIHNNLTLIVGDRFDNVKTVLIIKVLIQLIPKQILLMHDTSKYEETWQKEYIAKAENPFEVMEWMAKLAATPGLLNEENLDIVLQYPNNEQTHPLMEREFFIAALKHLLNPNNLDDAARTSMIEYKGQLWPLHMVLSTLRRASNTLATGNMKVFSSEVERFHQENLIDHRFFLEMLTHSNAQEYIEALGFLQKENLLDNSKRCDLYAHRYPYELAEIFKILTEVNLFDVNNQAALAATEDLRWLPRAYRALQTANMFTQTNFNAVLRSHKKGALSDAFVILVNSDLLMQNNIDAILTHHYPMQLADAFIILHRENILNEINRLAISQHCSPRHAALVTAHAHRQKLEQKQPESLTLVSNTTVALVPQLANPSLRSNPPNIDPFFNISMQIVGGFMTVIGVAAVAVAFIALNTLILGAAGVLTAGAGITLLLSSYGLFKLNYLQDQVTSASILQPPSS